MVRVRDFGHEDAGNASLHSLDHIVQTPSVKAFLGTNKKRYVVGPKGSGKTLILLRKAIDERDKGASVCIPSDPSRPVDRLDAAEHLGQRFFHKTGGESARDQHLSWTTVWKHSILSSVLHHLASEIKARLNKPAQKKRLQAIVNLDSPLPLRPFHYYRDLTNRLDSAPRDILARVREDLMHIDVFLQLSSRDVHVFLDNLDDYYEAQPDLWKQSMYGQFRAVREVSQGHRHVHLYTSIRQDVYAQFRDEMQLQYYDYVAELSYTADDLLEIFASRVRALEDDLLMVPAARERDPWRAFFGQHAELASNAGGTEPVQQYLLRQTLGRPRDIVHMGTVLLNDRREGFTAQQIRQSVARASEIILDQYLCEIEPLLAPIDFDAREFFIDFVPKDVMTVDEARACEEHYRDWKGLYQDAPAGRPLALLHDLGLLGVSGSGSGARGSVQHFRPTGRGLEAGTLPRASEYFLHPSVSLRYGHHIEQMPTRVGQGLPC